jgi:8-oxo-dGTP diphosphatase
MFFFYFFKFITNLLQIFYFIWGDNIKYKIPSLTVDIFIFNEENEFILIKRKNDPFKGYWALPGGFVDYGETTEHAAIREAKEETSIDVELVRLFNVYSDPNRDPRRHTVSVFYLAHGNFDDANADDDAEDIGVFSFDELDDLDIAFDHRMILSEVKDYLENN